MVAVAGIADLVLVCTHVDPSWGLVTMANDPGKSLFHIVILPLATMALLAGFPRDQLGKLWQRPSHRRYLVALTLLLVGVGTVFAHQDETHGFATRPPPPADIAEPSKRAALEEFERDWRRSDPATRMSGSEAQSEYASLITPSERDLDFWLDGSLRARSAFFLSWLGTMYAAAILWTLSIFVILRKQPSPGTLDSLVVGIALCSLWTVLTAYSDWYRNFGELSLAGHQAFTLVLVAIAADAVLIWLIRERKRPTVLVSAAVTGVMGVLAGFAKFSAETLTPVAESFAELGSAGITACYLMGTLVLVAAVRLSLPEHSG